MKEKYENYILYGTLIIVVIGLVYAFTGFNFNSSKITGNGIKDIKKTETLDNDFKTISSGTTNDGEVSVELKPHKVKNGKINVDISVNTHSVDLNKFDLRQITTLEYNNLIIYPTSAPTLTGHHNSGNLVFDIGENINSFTIKIKGIPKIEERVFKW